MHGESRSPVRLARDLMQVIQETVFSKRIGESPKRCPLVKEESDLTSSEDEERNDKRIANLIDFFFTIVKSQKNEDHRKGSGGSCFKSEVSPLEEVKTYRPKVNKELEEKMETLMEFLATTGVMNKDDDVSKDERKITLMEFLFGPEDRKVARPAVEIKLESDRKTGLSLSESNVNVKDLSYIDETPGEEGSETLVEMLLKYMENYNNSEKFKEPAIPFSMTCMTPSLSEKSKSDVTISRLETFSDISKTKSDSSLTKTLDTVIDRFEDLRSEKSTGSRRISEAVVDLSHVKDDLENILLEAALKVCSVTKISFESDDDVMSEQEDLENFAAYTKPAVAFPQYVPYSFELSDILEEDEPSSRDLERKSSKDDRLIRIKQLAEELLVEIEKKVQSHFEEKLSSSGPSTEDFSREMDLESPIKRSSISLIDLRNIPDLPPSMMIKPNVVRVDKSTSTTEISESMSDLSRRIDSACMTEDTSLSSCSLEKSERVLDKIESLHRFFSKSRLEIIDESLEENGDKKAKQMYLDSDSSASVHDMQSKVGQASLDDVEDLLDDCEKQNEDSESDDGISV